jgi:hypothetical protein
VNRCDSFRPEPSIFIRTASTARATPSCSEHRSFDSFSGSIGTTRSGK